MPTTRAKTPSRDRAATSSPRNQHHARTAGTHCVWPRGVEERYDISAPTRWRWERQGLLPSRDVFVGGKPVGWRPETLDAAERGQVSAA